MKRGWLSISLVFLSLGCARGDSEEVSDSEDLDSGTETVRDTSSEMETGSDMEVMSENPSCLFESEICFSWYGSFYEGRDMVAYCARVSEPYEENGSDPMVAGNGCPTRAIAECSGLKSRRGDGSKIANSEYSIYTYNYVSLNFPEWCEDTLGGTYAEL